MGEVLYAHLRFGKLGTEAGRVEGEDAKYVFAVVERKDKGPKDAL